MTTPDTTSPAVAALDQPADMGHQDSGRLFELAPSVIEIVLRVRSANGRHELTHRLRPPTLEDWCEYERNLKSSVVTSEQSPETLEFGSALMEAALTLYDRLFLSASGYCIANGQEAACAQLPPHHKEMAIRALGDVGPEDPQDQESAADEVAPFSLDPERVSVRLRTDLQGASYSGLTHVFVLPTATDRITYSRIVSQALYVRGSRNFKTLLPPRLPALVKLYDQLICEVNGYAVHGQGLQERAMIVRHMSALHKKAAIQELFEG